MNMDKKNIVIICLIVALLIVGWIAFRPTPVPYDKELIEAELKRLSNENDSLSKDMAKHTAEKKKWQQEKDSLQNLKPQIIIKYESKYKEIDNASVNTVVNDFNNVFTNNNVR